MIILFYSLCSFISAFLLFLIQPLFTKTLLPLLGGSAAVWNTAMLFFQTLLLLGYAYSHFSTRFSLKKQSLIHMILLGASFAFLPIALRGAAEPPVSVMPIGWILRVLTISIGAAYFILACTAPLIQKWLSSTRGSGASDPYFLYATSNIGSFMALLGYPFLMEPLMHLPHQKQLWSLLYLVFAICISVCMILMWKNFQGEQKSSAHPEEKISTRRKVKWVFWAFIPSAYLLGVTLYISSEVAAIPLLWVVPLTLYLLSFILVFSQKRILSISFLYWLFPFLIVPLTITLAATILLPLPMFIPWHLLTFFLICIFLHGQLAEDRPQIQHLTQFYLWLSVGGVLGGIFNVLIAPQIFSRVYEYPIAVTLACLALSNPSQGSTSLKKDLILSAFIFALVLIFYHFIPQLAASEVTLILRRFICFGLPGLVIFGFRRQSRRFGLTLGALMLAGCLTAWADSYIFVKRSFFGVNAVLKEGENIHKIYHGSTVHGIQNLSPEMRHIPLGYYDPSGPVGNVMNHVKKREKPHIAVLGLGAGSLSAYASENESWDFYEIDPVVLEIAKNPALFTYLQDCKASYHVILGDGRISISKMPDHSYDLIILDAFSSDSIPFHLITHEAIQLYQSKLKENGLLLFNISNRYLDLRGQLFSLAITNRLEAKISIWGKTFEEAKKGFFSAWWFVMGTSQSGLQDLDKKIWKDRPASTSDVRVWTDNYSNLISAFKKKP